MPRRGRCVLLQAMGWHAAKVGRAHAGRANLGRNATARGSLARVTAREGRAWGFWTRHKLAILEDYLPAFLHASKNKASEYVYLDAFAGEGEGIDRLTGEQFPGSSRIALDVAVAGGFTRLRFFERTSKASELE